MRTRAVALRPCMPGRTDTAGMADSTRLAKPYPSPEAAARATTSSLVVGLGAFFLGYGGALTSVFLSEPASASGGGAGPFSTMTTIVGPTVALLVAAGERKKLDQAAGRKLQSWEVRAIRNSTAAGQLVDEPDLIVAQEYFARRHMSVTSASVLGVLLTLLLVLPLAGILWWARLEPIVFVAAATCVALGSLYLGWSSVRRAAGSEETNAIFDEPLSPEEAQEL